MILTLPENELRKTGYEYLGQALMDFYKLMVKEQGKDWDSLKEGEIMPGRIYISPALYDHWTSQATNEDELFQLNALFVNIGPKTDESLAFNEVCIEE